MPDYIDVVEHSPITFVKKVCEAIKDGYAVTNTIPGYPQFGAYGNTIRLTKADKKSGVVVSADHNGRVEHYEPMAFMLLVQDFVNAGYTFKDDGQHFFDEKGLKSIQMEKVEPKAKAEAKTEEQKTEEKKTPAKKASNKKPLKAEPTKDELEAE